MSAREKCNTSPMWKPNSTSSWGTTAKLFHWLIAVLIFAQFGLGWWATLLKLSPLKINLFVWHKSIGMLILVLVIARLLWRCMNPTPTLPADTPDWERFAARASHLLLYVLMLALPLSGWLLNSAAGVPFRIFRLIPLPSLIAPDKHIAEMAALVHLLLFLALAALLLVHIGAALRHHFIKRNDVLRRMWPARRSST